MKIVLRPRGSSYQSKLLSLFRNNLVGFWPLYETAGATANDFSLNLFNGTYSNVSLANLADHFNHNAPLYNGGNSMITLPDLSTKFNREEGGISVWIRCAAGLFDDATNNHNIMYLRYDATNYISIGYSTIKSIRMLYVNGGVTQGMNVVYNSTGVWTNLVFTWSKTNNQCKGYLNGDLIYTDACNGNLAGNPGTRYIGSFGATWGWSGHISNVMLINRMLTASEARLCAHAPRMGVLGDSISADYSTPYWPQIVGCELAEPHQLVSHAVGGHSIMSNLADQVSNTISDGAAIEIVALGANDDNAGDMEALQAEVEDQLYRLRLLNTNARIYYMNVLPCWDDNTSGPEKPKGNIRTAIAAACANADNVTCWDTYTDPWLAQDKTTDGVHPNPDGMRSIANRILALL